MRMLGLRYKILCGLSIMPLTLLASYVWIVPLASVRGHLIAEHDVARGRYEILTYGLADSSRSAYGNLLEKHYGIRLYAIAGCIVSPDQVNYVAAYNKVSEAAIKQKFGPDVLREAAAQAEREMLPVPAHNSNL